MSSEFTRTHLQVRVWLLNMILWHTVRCDISMPFILSKFQLGEKNSLVAVGCLTGVSPAPAEVATVLVVPTSERFVDYLPALPVTYQAICLPCCQRIFPKLDENPKRTVVWLVWLVPDCSHSSDWEIRLLWNYETKMVCGSGLPRVMNDAAKVLLHDIQRLLPRTGPRISILDIHIEITRHAYVCCGIYTYIYIYVCVYHI